MTTTNAQGRPVLPITIKLEGSVLAHGQQVSEITISRAPTVADLIWGESNAPTDSSIDNDAHVLSRLCNVPPSTIHALQPWDFLKLQQVLAAFLRGPSGGANSSASSPTTSAGAAETSEP